MQSLFILKEDRLISFAHLATCSSPNASACYGDSVVDGSALLCSNLPASLRINEKSEGSFFDFHDAFMLILWLILSGSLRGSLIYDRSLLFLGVFLIFALCQKLICLCISTVIWVCVLCFLWKTQLYLFFQTNQILVIL